jgi:hydroxymethylpyrimidine/phosphomethylpyrimidine kinase
MSAERPFVMSIAGFDPSGGAGLLADIKTFEQHGVYGLGVITANTFQTEVEVSKVNWIPVPDIIEQIGLLASRWDVKWFKIGIVESSSALGQIVQSILQQVPEAKIVWDPVLRASSGFSFFQSGQDVSQMLKYVTILTPNLSEFEFLIGTEQKALELSWQTMIYLKGGHRLELGQDILYKDGEMYCFNPSVLGTAKHGSGCILSSAICANLDLGRGTHDALQRSKNYIEQVLTSNSTLLGWHSKSYDQ